VNACFENTMLDLFSSPSFFRYGGIATCSIFFFLLIEERNLSQVFVPLETFITHVRFFNLAAASTKFNYLLLILIL